MDRPLRHFADDRLDCLGHDAARREADSTVDIRVGHGAAGERFEGERLGNPLLAESSRQSLIVAGRTLREAVEETMCAFENAARPLKALPGEQRGAQPRLSRPAGM